MSEVLFSMKLNDLIYGWACIEFKNRENTYYIDFDECLSDPFPNLARTYLKLKNKENFHWWTESRDYFELKIANIDENIVVLYIRLKYEGENNPVFIEERLDRGELIKIIDLLFKEVLDSPDFPYQYPCHSDLDDIQYTKIDDYVFNKYNHLSDKEYEQIEKKYIRENIKLDETTVIFAETYRNMLVTYKVPDEWCLCEIIR